MPESPLTPIEIGLTAAIVTVEDEEPAILVAGDGATGEPRAGLPFGAFDPLTHRTFEIGLRAWVEAQTGLAVGYVEQLYTFGDRGRHARPGDTGAHVVSIGYLALTRMPENLAALRARSARRSSTRSSCRCSRIGRDVPPSPRRRARSAAASACARASRSAAARGTKRRCSTATSCSTRPAWSRKRAATAAKPRWRGKPCRGWESQCASITAASSPPRLRGCAPSSNTVRSYSS